MKEVDNKLSIILTDPMQKWLPLSYSFVRIQNGLTNFARDNKFFTIFVSKTKLQKNNIKAAIFA